MDLLLFVRPNLFLWDFSFTEIWERERKRGNEARETNVITSTRVAAPIMAHFEDGDASVNGGLAEEHLSPASFFSHVGGFLLRG